MHSVRDSNKLHAVARRRRLAEQFLKPYRWLIALAAVGLLVQSLLLLPIPLLQGCVLDLLVQPVKDESASAVDTPTMVWSIVAALIASIVCLLGRMVVGWRSAGIMIRVSLEVVRELTDAMHRKLQRLPVAFYDREQTGRLMSRITSDVGSLLVFLNSGSLQIVADMVLASGIAVTLFVINWQLALVALLAVPCYAANHHFFTSRLRQCGVRVRAQVAALYALLSERLSAVRVVRSFAQEEAELAALDRRIDAHRDAGLASLHYGTVQNILALVLSGLGTVAVLAYGAFLLAEGMLSAGDLLASYALIAQLYNPMVRLTQLHATISGTLAAVDHITEVLEEPESVSNRSIAKPILRPRGSLTFESVSFSYHANGPLILDAVNLAIAPGMKVGILGASGAGKSTLLALAPRLYDLGERRGRVLFDGDDVRDLRLADLRRNVALVPQHAVLFEGTIRSNVVYARPDASPSIITEALHAVDLLSLISSLPLGLDTPVGERGVSLSGGQRQRLALARVLVTEPRVLLLDDCTNALDAATEARVQKSLSELLPGRTWIVVSHQIASLCDADLIVVLDHGRIVEQGTHGELVAWGGTYAATLARQAGASFEAALAKR